MRNFSIDGRLGKDAELNTANGGMQYLRFSVANNTYTKAGGEKTNWVDVVCFDPFLIKAKQAVLKKGVFVIVSGELDPITVNTLQDGRTFVNERLNATFIEAPNLGKPEAEGATQTVQAAQQVQQPQMMPAQQQMPQATPVAQVAQPTVPQYTAQIPAGNQVSDGTSDLPF